MNIEWVKNKNKEKFYPVTHADAVLTGNGSETINEAVSAVNDTLEDISYSDIAGGKNKIKDAYDVYKGAYDLEVTTLDGYNCIRFTSAYEVDNTPIEFKQNTQYAISFDLKMVERQSGGGDENIIKIKYSDGSASGYYGEKNKYTNWTRFNCVSDANKTIESIGLTSKDYRTYCYVKDFQMEEGTQATPYEPYIPSVKMLAEETEQLNTNLYDEIMLGWRVPKECPIQNELNGNQFVQRVGRVDLGTLSWTYQTNPNRFSATFNDIKYENTNVPINAYIDKYDVYSFNSSLTKDKAISAWGNSSVSSNINIFDSSLGSTGKPSGWLYYELATEVVIKRGNEVANALKADLSDEWFSSKTYVVGEYCISDNGFWKCKVQHSNQKPTEGTYWTKTNIGKELIYLKSLIK